jgi:hypothetical protein
MVYDELRRYSMIYDDFRKNKSVQAVFAAAKDAEVLAGGHLFWPRRSQVKHRCKERLAAGVGQKTKPKRSRFGGGRRRIGRGCGIAKGLILQGNVRFLAFGAGPGARMKIYRTKPFGGGDDVADS